LDIIKTRMQVQSKRHHDVNDPNHYVSTLDAVKKIVSEDGVLGLYTGLFGGLLGVASTNFAYFYWYSLVREAYHRRHPKLGTFMELILGAAAGALAQIFTIPVSVCTTRQQTSTREERRGLFTTGRDIVREDGISGLWRGLKPSLVLCINPAITYGLFERIKDVMFPNEVRLTPGQSFWVGAVSKTIATLVTYPYIMAKVRMQHKPPAVHAHLHGTVEPEDHHRQDGAVQILQKIYKRHGALGWYKGIGPQITKAVITQAILFYFKEVFTQYTILLFALVYRIRTNAITRKYK